MAVNTFDQPIFNPQIADVLSLVKRETMLEINCVHVGKIKSYTSATNTATVTINVIRNLKNGTTLEYPELEDCPVFMLYGGTASITMPIQAGDDCLILFNDRCLDDWALSGDVVAPTDTRIHSLSDGIVLVGVKSMADVTAVPSCLSIHGGTNKISIKNSTADADLKILIDALIDAIVNIVITPAAVGVTGTLMPNTKLVFNAPLVGLKAKFAKLLL